MGYGIALNLLKAGHSLQLIANRRRENIEKLVDQGAAEAQDYAELLAGAEAVVSCVGTAEQIKAVVEKAEGHLEEDSLWIDFTTSRSRTALEIYQRLKKRGVDFFGCAGDPRSQRCRRRPADSICGRRSGRV
jgi:3-hydroxyisobutyrate dehydrogenase-like beta-hydroxyacid dehydrogenase